MTRRLSVLVLLIATVVGGVVLDRNADVGVGDDDEAVTALGIASAGVIPVASSTEAASSTWFCAGGSSDEEAFADHVITMLNPTDAPVRATVTVHAGEVLPPPANADVEDELDDATAEESGGDEAADDGSAEAGEPVEAPSTAGPAEPERRVIEVAASSRTQLALSDVVSAPVASALVEADAGGLVVEHEVSSVNGFDAKPCATSANDVWHLAWGTTERDARELLVLFNPFPDDAIVEGRFSTEDGVREPSRFDGGIVVPARSTLAVDLGDDVPRRAEVAGTLRARSGRIVVDRIVRLAEDGGARGLTVQTAVPEPQQAWLFPDGFVDEDTTETYVVYNPGTEVAEVAISVTLEDPDVNGIPAPFDLSLAPGTHASVDIGADERVPSGVAHSAAVRSENGVGIVAERVITSVGESRRGISVTTGTPLEAETWQLAAGATSDASDQWITIWNADPLALAEVDVVAVVNGQEVEVSGLQDVVVQAGERTSIRMGERIQRDDLALVVRATEPVTVERAIYRVGDDEIGTSTSVGVPTPTGLRLPVDPLDVAVDVDLGDDTLEDAPTVDDVPVAPEDVELPEGDETIEFDDPDAEADVPGETTTTEATTTTVDGGGEGDATTTSTTAEGVPETTP